MTKEQWEALLDINPMDWDLRMIYADWLEETGDELAKCQRWMAENKKYPGPPCLLEANTSEATWFCESQVGVIWLGSNLVNFSVEPTWCLPDELFKYLSSYLQNRRDGGFHHQFAKPYISRREAEYFLNWSLRGYLCQPKLKAN